MPVSRAVPALFAVVAGLAAWRLRRYEIAEESMAPALLPGDYVVAVRRPRQVRPGAVVVFEHPGRPGFTVVKRVVAVGGGLVSTRGDNRAASADVEPVPLDRIEGRVVWRYWPPRR